MLRRIVAAMKNVVADCRGGGRFSIRAGAPPRRPSPTPSPHPLNFTPHPRTLTRRRRASHACVHAKHDRHRSPFRSIPLSPPQTTNLSNPAWRPPKRH